MYGHIVSDTNKKCSISTYLILVTVSWYNWIWFIWTIWPTLQQRAIRLQVLPLYTNNQPTDLKLHAPFVSCNMERSNQKNLIQ